MYRLALRGILAHRGRLAGTVIAVLLGVAFIAGTFTLTDTLKAAINSFVSKSQPNVSLLVQPRALGKGASTNQFFGGTSLTLPQTVAGHIEHVPGVKAVAGAVFGQVHVEGPKGQTLGKGGLNFDLGIYEAPVKALSQLSLIQGQFPNSAHEVAVSAKFFQNSHLHLGETLLVAGNANLHPFTLVGVIAFGSGSSLAGTTIVDLNLPAAQGLLGVPGRFTNIAVQADPGVTPDQLRDRVAAALGSSYQVETQAQAQASFSQSIDKGFSVFSDVLLLFGGIALFVALFLIFNTFSILLTQRAAELALLRCIGAFRRQLVASVVTEALAVGAIASTLGLGVGILLSVGIRELLSKAGIKFPNVGVIIEARTVIVSYVVGIAATSLAALLPAIRASRTAPITALRAEQLVETRILGARRLIFGLVIAVIGVAFVVRGLNYSALIGTGNGGRAETAGIGLAALFAAVVALMPAAVPLIANGIGAPMARLWGTSAQLGRRNAARHPRRTSATAAALMIGMTLVTTVAVFSQSVNASTTSSLESGLHADVVVTGGQGNNLSTSVATALEHNRDLADVAEHLHSSVEIEMPGHKPVRTGAAGVPVLAYAADVDIPINAGSLARVKGREIAVTNGLARTWHLHVGSYFALASTQSKTQLFVIAAITGDPTGLTGSVIMSVSGFSILFPEYQTLVDNIYVRAAPGVSATMAFNVVNRLLINYPTAGVDTKSQYISDQQGAVNTLFAILSVLLGLAIVIALFGVMNTLALSIIERHREIGLLRALGMSRTQVRGAVRVESVIVTLLGMVAGIALGVFFGWVVVDVSRDNGVDTFAIPYIRLVIFLIVGAIAAVAAAVIPARSAIKVDILAAISSE